MEKVKNKLEKLGEVKYSKEEFESAVNDADDQMKKIKKAATKKQAFNMPADAKIKTFEPAETIQSINEKNADMIAVCGVAKKHGFHMYKSLSNGKTACICGRLVSINKTKEAAFNKRVLTNAAKIQTENKKEKVKKPAEKPAETWVKSLNYHDLYHLKGIKSIKGIFSPCTAANKSGLVFIEEFLNPENRFWKNKKYLVSLGRYRFDLMSGDKIGIEEVFENIERNAKQLEGFKIIYLPEQLEMLVPGYDPDKFKDYHAQKVFDWFQEIREKVIVYVKEGEEEIKAEEKTKAKTKAKPKAKKKTETKTKEK